MFTGIIEDIGCITTIDINADGKTISISSTIITDDLNDGDSVCVDGVCLTAYNINNNTFSVDVVKETLEKSNLGGLENKSLVNLERSLTLSSRIGGHLLQGHVECQGKIIDKVSNKHSETILISVDTKIIKYCLEKG